MKRLREIDNLESTSVANCLMLLSQGKERFPAHELSLRVNKDVEFKIQLESNSPKEPSFSPFNIVNNFPPSRVFECKTCNRQFPSFQALGGHRASHKKPRLMGIEGILDVDHQSSPTKPKTHECSICGLEFAVGQALGGHMRRHRAALNDQNRPNGSLSPPSRQEEVREPFVKRSSNSRRVMLCLDLNLTPLENDLELFKLGKSASMDNRIWARPPKEVAGRLSIHSSGTR